jgi:hypothetical protein
LSHIVPFEVVLLSFIFFFEELLDTLHINTAEWVKLNDASSKLLLTWVHLTWLSSFLGTPSSDKAHDLSDISIREHLPELLLLLSDT